MASTLIRHPAVLAAALVLGAAASARAQTVTVGSGTRVGSADCSSRAAINVSYAYSTPTGVSVKVGTTPTLQLFLSPGTGGCPAVADNATSVGVPDGGISLVSPGTQVDSSNPTATKTATTSVDKLTSGDCTTEQTVGWQVCFYEFINQTTDVLGNSKNVGYSPSTTPTITYDSQPPNTPSLDVVESGDQHLKLSFSEDDANSDINEFTVYALAIGTVDGGALGIFDGGSGPVDAGNVDAGILPDGGVMGDGGMPGDAGASTGSESGYPVDAQGCLVGATTFGTVGADQRSANAPTNGSTFANNTVYLVQVRATDLTNNVSRCSNALPGVPVVINDFWRIYKRDGGSETGCGQTGGGLAGLSFLGSVTLLILRARRRKDLP